MEDKMININVILADRPYRMKVNAAEEGMVREVAKEINKKVKEYQQSFSSKDKQDFLAMIALQNGVESVKAAGKGGISDPVSHKLDELDKLLSRFLAR
jgi:cell division protein ZapA